MTARKTRDTDAVAVPRQPYVAPRIHALATMLRRSFNLQARTRTGLTQEKARILVLLGDLQPLTPGELAENTSLDHAQISRTLSDLVAGGIIERRREGRTRRLSLTPEGEGVFALLRETAMFRNDELFRDFTENEQRLFLDMLDRIIVSASEQLARARAECETPATAK